MVSGLDGVLLGVIIVRQGVEKAKKKKGETYPCSNLALPSAHHCRHMVLDNSSQLVAVVDVVDPPWAVVLGTALSAWDLATKLSSTGSDGDASLQLTVPDQSVAPDALVV